MTVLENVAYGLRVKGMPTADRDARRRSEVLERVRLPRYVGTRRPSALSGGQRQRVALARAIVNRPTVLLLDEPLGALDLKLRQEMQIVLKELQRELGITFVYVTHDQEEALDDERPHRRLQRRAASSRSGRRPRSTSIRRPSSSRASSASRTCSSATAGGSRSGPRRSLIEPARAPRASPDVVRDVVYLGMATRYIVDARRGRRARRRPAEPRDVVPGGVRGAGRGSACRGGRSTPTRSARREE